MKFTKLRLVGFKTFVEPTEFLIEKGLTGVVGPNGCGKSNLVEALRWVMGENSYKNMRASGMDDVIFSGNNARPARNSAEVTLVLDNDERRAPAAFNEVDRLEVSRRIEREAGSVYRVNGKEVRARDVQMLFADASTGARSPAMVRQGQIGELIAAKPSQRRAILEEASGISGLHSRRHEAEMRLRAAEQNLERLEDVLTQIDGQLDGLKRQARQAARYRLLSAEIRATEATVAYLKWVAARTVLADAAAALADADRLLAVRSDAQTAAARGQAIAAHAVPGLREKEAAAGAALQRLRLAAADLDAEERRVVERLAEIQRRLQQIAEDRRREDGLAAEMAEATAALAREAAELVVEAEEAAGRGEAAAERLAETEARLEVAEAALAEAQREAADVGARRTALERRRDDLALRHDRIRRGAEAAGEERAVLAARFAREDERAARTAARDEAEAVAEAAEGDAIEAEMALGLARMAADAARVPLAEAERDLQRLDTEARTLAGLLAVDGLDLWPPVVDALAVEPGYEAALAAALGDDLDVSADPAAPIRWTELPSRTDPALPAGVAPLGPRVRAPAVLARALAQVGLVDRADGARLQKSLAAGQRLVSREGDLWRWDGLVAAAEAPTAAAQRLAGRNRLAELQGLVEAARSRTAERKSALESARRALAAAESRERLARDGARQTRRAAEAAREALRKAEDEAGRLGARLASLEETAGRLAAEAEAAAEAVAAAAEEAAGLPDTRRLDEALAAARAAASSERAAVAEARAVLQGLAREDELRRRRLEAIRREEAGWTQRVANAARQREVLDRRQTEAESERDDLIDRPEAIAESRIALLAETGRAETARRAAADRLAEAETALAAADRVAREALEGLSAARESRGRAEERHAAARDRTAALEAEIAQAFEVRPPGLVDLAGLKPEAVLPDLDGVERRAERLRAEREKLGGVNLRAEDEVRDVEGRRDGLAAERDELIEAIRRLRLGISNLNREARERLMAAFEVVDGHFRSLFTHLFGGGTAELQLVESDDPLEAGLEIFARPPGKKPSTMTLLSGGEQALTATALIFAVFLTNPAPICVLDEVDAPLDDANVERYCDLLGEMSRLTDTRFLVITHNPITMARMDRLFGVTMAERGVSQLVSVDLERAERFLEAG